MSREVKRVPLNFNHPMGEIWEGYLNSCGDDCTECENTVCPGDPPKGEGYQMWETVSDGAPISPVFKTPEELAQWLSDTNASAFGNETATYDEWLKMIHAEWSPTCILTPNGMVSGVKNI